MNTETLLLSAAVVEGSLALGMIGSEYGRRRPGWRAWAASCGVRALSHLIYLLPLAGLPLLRRSLPFVAAMLMLASAALAMRSIARFVAARPPGWIDLAPWMVCVLGYVVAFWVYDDPSWRVATVSLGLGWGLGWACWRTLSAEGEIEHERRFVAVALGAWCALQAIRAVYALTIGATLDDAPRPLAMHPWYFIGYMVAAIATAVGLLALRNRQLLAELDAARRDALRRADYDMLTGLLSRTTLLDRAEGMFRESLSQDRPLWLLMIDVDHFKQVNDRYGHLVGDSALHAIGEVIRRKVPKPRLAGRFGGEEFMVALLGQPGESPRSVAENLRLAVHSIVMDSGRRAGGLTVSIGAATRDEADRSVTDLIRRADEALLEAKRNGRDRVVIGPAGGGSAQPAPEQQLKFRHSDFIVP